MSADSQYLNSGLAVTDQTGATPGAIPRYTSAGGLVTAVATTPSAKLGGATIRLLLTHGKNDNGTTLAASAGAGVFGITNTTGTSISLSSEAANGNTKTDKCIFEVQLPQFYKAGDSLTVTVNALHTLNSGTASVKTVQAKAYLLASDGTSSADLIGAAAQATTTAAAEYTFTIAGATLTAGARLLIQITAVITETASGGGVVLSVNSVRIS